jgi:hypothetical protein
MKYKLFSSESEAKEWLGNGTEYDEEVTKGYRSAQQMGVTGVPFFIVDNKYAISGAVGEEAFVDVSLSSSKTIWQHAGGGRADLGSSSRRHTEARKPARTPERQGRTPCVHEE